MFSQSKSRSESDHDFADVPVPIEERRPLYEMVLNLGGGPICVAALFAGASLTQGLTFVEAATAVIAGGVILAVYGGLIGSIGSRSGLSTGLLLRQTFGARGSMMVTVVIAVCLVGWFAVQTGMFGEVIHAMFPNGGVVTDTHFAAFWGGMLMLTTAYLGYRGLSYLSLLAVPLLVLLCIWGLVSAASGADLSGYKPPTASTIGNGMTMVVGALCVGATTTADITRYAKSSAHSWTACVLGYLVTNAFMLIGGVVTAIATGTGDLMAAMLALGMGVPALLILILGQWTTNDDNLYSSSLAISGVLPSLKKHYVVLFLGLVATVIGAAGVSTYFVPFLLTLGIAIPPVGGILIADHLILRREQQEHTDDVSWSYSAFAAWIIGAAVGGLVPFGIPAVNSTLSALAVYVLLNTRSAVNAKTSIKGEVTKT